MKGSLHLDDALHPLLVVGVAPGRPRPGVGERVREVPSGRNGPAEAVGWRVERAERLAVLLDGIAAVAGHVVDGRLGVVAPDDRGPRRDLRAGGLEREVRG